MEVAIGREVPTCPSPVQSGIPSKDHGRWSLAARRTFLGCNLGVCIPVLHRVKRKLFGTAVEARHKRNQNRLPPPTVNLKIKL